MIVNTKVLLFSILTLFSFGNAQFRVFRGDTRNPDQMRLEGRFRPRGQGLPLVTPDISMINHANGAASGASQDNDGYVSTSADPLVAENFLSDFFQGTGYVYTIAATPNFIQVAGTLGQFNPYSNEFEYAALGGFQWRQVIGYSEFRDSFEVGSFTANPDYNGSIYDRERPSNGEPFLAGFLPDDPAWSLAPWNAFAVGGACNPGANIPRRLRTRQETCGPDLGNVAAAELYMSRECPDGVC